MDYNDEERQDFNELDQILDNSMTRYDTPEKPNQFLQNNKNYDGLSQQ